MVGRGGWCIKSFDDGIAHVLHQRFAGTMDSVFRKYVFRGVVLGSCFWGFSFFVGPFLSSNGYSAYSNVKFLFLGPILKWSLLPHYILRYVPSFILFPTQPWNLQRTVPVLST